MSTFVMPRVAVSAPKIWNESLTKMVPLCFQVYVSGGVPPEIVAEAIVERLLADAPTGEKLRVEAASPLI